MARVHCAPGVHMQTPQIALRVSRVLQVLLPKMLESMSALYVHQEHLNENEHDVFRVLLATYPVKAPHHVFLALVEHSKFNPRHAVFVQLGNEATCPMRVSIAMSVSQGLCH